MKKAPPLTDTDLAAQANEYHSQVISGCIAVIHAARQAGQALNAAKRLVTKEAGDKKGTWQQWVKTHFKASIQTARVYMYIGREWRKLEPELTGHPGLSLARALQILKVKWDGTEKEAQHQDFFCRCRQALCQEFSDFVRDHISGATLVFLTGGLGGPAIVESRFRLFSEFQKKLETEVGPIAKVLFTAQFGRDTAFKKLGSTISPQQKEEIEATYVMDILDAFKWEEGMLTEYQREIILEEIGHSKVARDKPSLLEPFKAEQSAREAVG